MNPLSHYPGSQIPRLLLALIAATLLALTALALPGGAFAAPVRADHFAVTVSPHTVDAGDDFTITTTAKDASNATIKAYSGDIQLSDTSGQLSASAPGKWSGGVSKTTASVKVAAAGDVVTVQTADGTSGQSAAFNVAGSLDHFTVAVSPRPAIAGQDIKITATAKDANNTTVTGYAGKTDVYDSSQTMSVSDQGSFVNGVSTSTASVPNAIHGDVVYVKDPAADVAGQSSAFNVTGQVDHISLSAPSSVDASGSFDVTARALDAAGNTITSYSGPASWSDTGGVLSPSAPADFVNGVSKTSASVSSPTSGDVITLTAGDASAQRKFTAYGPVDHLDVRAPGSVAAGDPFTLTITARDAAGNVVTSAATPALFLLNDSNAIGGNLEPFKNGVSKTQESFDAPVKDRPLQVIADSGSYESNPVDAIGPPDGVVLAAYKRTDRQARCESVGGTLTFRLIDAAGNFLSSYNGPLLAWSDHWATGSINPAQPAPFVHGVSTTSFTLVDNYAGFNGGAIVDAWITTRPFPIKLPIRLC